MLTNALDLKHDGTANISAVGEDVLNTQIVLMNST